MLESYLCDFNPEGAKRVAERGERIVASVKGGIPWPKIPQVISYGGLTPEFLQDNRCRRLPDVRRGLHAHVMVRS